MIFNSSSYFFLVLIVFVLYWTILKNHRSFQNIFLLLVSYVFYSFWDWRFLFLLIFSTISGYVIGLFLGKAEKRMSDKILFWIGIVLNIGVLAFFKYFNFFIESFNILSDFIGFNTNLNTISLILPVGISFYTFHSLSYIIDVYKKRINPEKNFIDYSLFVSYFPLLIAGPIERATHLLPQLKRDRNFKESLAIDGLKQILWGLVKKIIIADQCAVFSNMIFTNYTSYSGLILFLGAVFFAIQIYGDFSGYSDIALGTSKLLGINLLVNFSYPYFSRSIPEFWKRWHISLSTWFRDYLYFPLGGSKFSKLKTIKNTFIIFFVSGFWHGSNWTFIFWGGLNALYFMPSLFFKSKIDYSEIVAKGHLFPKVKDFLMILTTFCLVTLAWIFFRIDTISNGFIFLIEIIRSIFYKVSYVDFLNFVYWKVGLNIFCFLFFFFLIEWQGRENEYAIKRFFKINKRIFIWIFYYFLVALILVYSSNKSEQFIYFQF